MPRMIAIVPAALREQADAASAAEGWGPNNYSVPLSPTGAAPATHYGLHTNLGPKAVALLADAETGARGPAVRQLMRAIDRTVVPDNHGVRPYAQFMAKLAELGLQRIDDA